MLPCPGRRARNCAVSERTFPDGFVWGAPPPPTRSRARPRDDGRGESIWDRFSHTPGKVDNGDTGDVACDHYHRYQDDVALMADLGSAPIGSRWPGPGSIPAGVGAGEPGRARLLRPAGRRAARPRHHALRHPVPLGPAPGARGRAAAGRCGRRPRPSPTTPAWWPPRSATGCRASPRSTSRSCSSDHGYREGSPRPGTERARRGAGRRPPSPLAHGLAVPAIRAGRARARGRHHPQPRAQGTRPRSHPLDLEAADGGPRPVQPVVPRPGHRARLPGARARATGVGTAGEVGDGDLELIAAPIDFLGVNYYTRHVVRSPARSTRCRRPSVPELTGMGWEVYPEGLTEMLEFVASRTGELPLYVTENGAAYPDDPDDPGRDPERVEYLRRHLDAALDRHRPAAFRCAGYFAWSLLDNFEWGYGYGQRFGIVHVDFDTFERVVRDSGRLWSAMARRELALTLRFMQLSSARTAKNEFLRELDRGIGVAAEPDEPAPPPPNVAVGIAIRPGGQFAVAVRPQSEADAGTEVIADWVDRLGDDVDVRVIGTVRKQSIPWYRQRIQTARARGVRVTRRRHRRDHRHVRPPALGRRGGGRAALQQPRPGQRERRRDRRPDPPARRVRRRHRARRRDRAGWPPSPRSTSTGPTSSTAPCRRSTRRSGGRSAPSTRTAA